MSSVQAGSGVHLVGSIPLSNEEEVFRTVSSVLGRRIARVPDGETGARFMWIGWQQQVFERASALQPVHDPEVDEEIAKEYAEQSGQGAAPPQFVLRDGMTAADLDFGSLGYAEAALGSYATFARLREEGVIPQGVRFQVSMGTPLATSSAFTHHSAFAEIEPVYEAAQLRELRAMIDGIPNEDLAIQWDVCVEVWMNEGWIPAPFEPVREGLVQRLVRISEAVPEEIELGYHMCYGDLGGHHLQEPDDTAGLVALMNPVFAGVARPIQWWHFPVPIARDDEAYVAPLRELRLHPETKVFAGVVHSADGEEGAQRRMAAVRTVFPEFGVATECGMGRKWRGSAEAEALLNLHAAVSEPA